MTTEQEKRARDAVQKYIKDEFNGEEYEYKHLDVVEDAFLAGWEKGASIMRDIVQDKFDNILKGL